MVCQRDRRDEGESERVEKEGEIQREKGEERGVKHSHQVNRRGEREREGEREEREKRGEREREEREREREREKARARARRGWETYHQVVLLGDV
jgi:hypothetical protein